MRKTETHGFSGKRSLEVLLIFENSRRVLTVSEKNPLLAAIEKDISERFPERDIAVAAVGEKVPLRRCISSRSVQRCGGLLMSAKLILEMNLLC